MSSKHWTKKKALKTSKKELLPSTTTNRNDNEDLQYLRRDREPLSSLLNRLDDHENRQPEKKLKTEVKGNSSVNNPSSSRDLLSIITPLFDTSEKSGLTSHSIDNTIVYHQFNHQNVLSPAMSTATLPTSLWWCCATAPVNNEQMKLMCYVTDIDNSLEPEWVADYSVELYDQFNDAEYGDQVSPTYLQKQTMMNKDKRIRIVNVMINLCRTLPLTGSSMFLAVYLLDKYLSRSSLLVRSTKLLQIGVAAMMIAAKYDEGNRAKFVDFFNILAPVDSFATRPGLVDLELTMLQTIGWAVHTPTPYTFLCRYVRAGELDSHASSIARCIAERALLEYSMLQFLPSVVAASAVSMARVAVGLSQWTPTLQHFTAYSHAELVPCVEELQRVFALETLTRARVYAQELLAEHGQTECTYDSLVRVLDMIRRTPTASPTAANSPFFTTPTSGSTNVKGLATLRSALSPGQVARAKKVAEYQARLPLILERYAADYGYESSSEASGEGAIEPQLSWDFAASPIGPLGPHIVPVASGLSSLGFENACQMFSSPSLPLSDDRSSSAVTNCSTANTVTQAAAQGSQSITGTELSPAIKRRIDAVLRQNITAGLDEVPTVHNSVRISYPSIYESIITCPP